METITIVNNHVLFLFCSFHIIFLSLIFMFYPLSFPIAFELLLTSLENSWNESLLT